MSTRRRTMIIVIAPIVAVATLMVGMRVGAREAFRSATVFAAPPGEPATPNGDVALAWQVLTYLEDRGVRETIAVPGIEVIARSERFPGHEARWKGSSNADGIAEAYLKMPPGFSAGDPVDVEVRVEGESLPLAAGRAEWRSELGRDARGARDDEGRAAVRPSKRVGAVGVDVLIEGERLVPGFHTPIWVRATPPHGEPKAGISVEATPEQALAFDRSPMIATTCEGGWAELPALAQGHVAGLGVVAKGRSGAAGEWFGALPVAPGAFFIGAPRVLEAGKPTSIVLVAPNTRNVAYAEVDDERGRVFAAALSLTTTPGDPTPRATLAMPPLAKGLHWIVVSGEPRGAERLAGAAIARPILVGTAEEATKPDACAIGPRLAQHPAVGFPRWVAIEGIAVRGAQNRARHRLGLFIGLVSLLAAGILEAILLTAASREARAVMLLADLDEPEADRARITAKPPGGGLAVALCLAVLGFALLAALVVAKG